MNQLFFGLQVIPNPALLEFLGHGTFAPRMSRATRTSETNGLTSWLWGHFTLVNSPAKLSTFCWWLSLSFSHGPPVDSGTRCFDRQIARRTPRLCARRWMRRLRPCTLRSPSQCTQAAAFDRFGPEAEGEVKQSGFQVGSNFPRNLSKAPGTLLRALFSVSVADFCGHRCPFWFVCSKHRGRFLV